MAAGTFFKAFFVKKRAKALAINKVEIRNPSNALKSKAWWGVRYPPFNMGGMFGWYVLCGDVGMSYVRGSDLLLMRRGGLGLSFRPGALVGPFPWALVGSFPWVLVGPCLGPL